jgi:DNA-binding transcriptional MerR regulator
MSGEWLSAGAFARRSRLSAKALRLYARDGVLVPNQVDPHNGYRRYHVDQLRDARLVRMLRRAGLPIAVVAQVLAAPRPERPGLVEAHWAEAERTFRYQRELVTHLIRTLDGGEDSYPMYEVKVRDIEEQTLLTEQSYVAAAGLREWIVDAALRQLRHADALGGPVGPRVVIYHGEVNEDSDGPVEQALPIAPARAGEAELPWRTEPAHREAYVAVTRAQVRYPDIVSAYDAVERWISDTGHTVAGPPREVYHADPSEGPDDEHVADVAFPIEAR